MISVSIPNHLTITARARSHTQSGLESYLSNRASVTHRKGGRKTETYLRQYAPRSFDDPLEHVEFGLKYDGVELAFLREVFSQLSPESLAAYIQKSPTGKYAKQVGFFYEFLTGSELPRGGLAGNYVQALDPEEYVTAETVKNPRWRVNDNLLGPPAFSPTVRLTDDEITRLEQAYADGFAGD